MKRSLVLLYCKLQHAARNGRSENSLSSPDLTLGLGTLALMLGMAMASVRFVTLRSTQPVLCLRDE